MGEREIRIGDAERERALGLLGEHLGAGRLTVDEYGERTALVTTAKTRGELLALFSDLPEPHPRFAQAAPLPPAPPPARRTLDARVLVPLAGILCVALFFVFKNPFVLLLVPVVALVIGRTGRR